MLESNIAVSILYICFGLSSGLMLQIIYRVYVKLENYSKSSRPSRAAFSLVIKVTRKVTTGYIIYRICVKTGESHFIRTFSTISRISGVMLHKTPLFLLSLVCPSN